MGNIAKTIEVLNDLILINNDRIKDYERAIKEIETDNENRDLLPVFLKCIDDSRRFIMALGVEVEVLGKDMKKGTTMSGKLHRAWLEVKEPFTGHDRRMILGDCEFSEDATKRAYHDAIKQEHLQAHIREMLIEQKAILMNEYNEIRELHDRVH
jgi:uncharacterized protein (TIGR02284 family)